MLRVVPFKSAARAHEYYAQALVKDDYYTKGKEATGIWFGKLAERLGLKGAVQSEEFEALANNLHPQTGEQLTVRQRKDRVTGADFCFGLPKSVSILYAMTGDKRIVRIVQNAVEKMMKSIERDVQTRVRTEGRYEDRQTGSLACALFHHKTSRPVQGVPDPHYHTHGFVFNITYDEVEKKYKALKFRGSKQNAPVHEAVMRSHLAKGFEDLGYSVKKVGKSFEIVGIPRKLIQKFSRRTTQIEELIAQHSVNASTDRDKIGALSREAKKSDMTTKQILEAWKERLDTDERKLIEQVIENCGKNTAKTVTLKECVDHAEKHCFALKSVVKWRDLFREAVAYGYGAYLPDDIRSEISRRNFITGTIRGVEHCTSQSVLREESKIIEFVRNGKGRFNRFAKHPYEVSRKFFSDEQVRAVREMLYSRHQVIGLQGVSGGGKTTAMQEVVEGIEKSGKQVFILAPTHEAVRTLKKDGFLDASTLASFLSSHKIQRATYGQVIWVDEASMIGSEAMLRLCEIAGKHTRILFSGDVNQHSSISRGEPFRQLQKYKVLQCARIQKVIRQDEGYYRDAAQALANGDIDSAFANLQAMGAIVEIENNAERYQALAEKYAERLHSGETPLLISPTHAEGQKIVAAIRSYLRKKKRLGKDQELMRLVNLQWSDAEKSLPERFKQGYEVEFNQNAKGGIVRGSRYSVIGHDEKGQVLISDKKGNTSVLNMALANRYDVYQKKSIALAKGDMVRMTNNGWLNDGRRYYRGQVYQIARIYPSGSIKLKNGGLIRKDYCHINYGYFQTSYSSQSRTSKAPEFLAQSSEYVGASSLKQFYVSVTRGKSEFSLYTDNVDQLVKSVRDYRHSLTALEFSKIQLDSLVSEDNSKDNPFPYDVTDKERAAIFNKDGEFRHTPESIRHDVGGSFVGMVTDRRRKPDNRSAELAELRRAYMQGEKAGFKKAVSEQKKQWANKLKKQRGVGERVQAKSGESQNQQVKAKKTHWRKHLGKKNTKSKPVGEAIRGKRQRAQETVDSRAVDNEQLRNGQSFSQRKRKQAAKRAQKGKQTMEKTKNMSNAQAKGKHKGKSKALPKKPSPKKVAVVRVTRGR